MTLKEPKRGSPRKERRADGGGFGAVVNSHLQLFSPGSKTRPLRPHGSRNDAGEPAGRENVTGAEGSDKAF